MFALQILFGVEVIADADKKARGKQVLNFAILYDNHADAKLSSGIKMLKIDETVHDAAGNAYPLNGTCAPEFDRVLDAFRENFERGEEVGAACAVYKDGACVVDLWGGYRDAARTQPWVENTIVNMMSVAKAFTSTAVAMLVERGEVDYDAPVARYWPEFAANGKQEIPVRWVLDHRAGLPVLRPSLDRGDIYDWEKVTSALAGMVPLWEPGTQAGYHILTMGFLAGEIIRRVTGKMPGAFIADEIALPLGLDYAIGLSESDFARVAEFIPATDGTIFAVEDLPEEEFLKYAWAELPRDEDFNSSAWRNASIPGANGHGNARAVARFFGCLANDGILDGLQVIRPETIQKMSAEQHNHQEVVMKRSYHQALGVLRNSPPINPMGPNPSAFGHHGVGGSVGIADPAVGLGFAYSMNQMHARIDNGPRAGRLKAAAFQSVYFDEKNWVDIQ